MKTYFNDETGKRYTRWLVLGLDEEKRKNGYKRYYFICKCDCGKIKSVSGTALRNGKTHSCGCINREIVNKLTTTHHKSRTPLYNIWFNMKYRCNSPKCKVYNRYGGRGIKICEEWENDFMNFYNWAIQNGYKEIFLPNGKNLLTLDRINNDGNYEPSNCRWVTRLEQARNTRNNKHIVYNGKTYCISELNEMFGLSRGLLQYRLKRGYSIEEALCKKLKRRNKNDKQI